MDWFLYDNGLRLEMVKSLIKLFVSCECKGTEAATGGVL